MAHLVGRVSSAKGWTGVYCKVYLPKKKGVFWADVLWADTWVPAVAPGQAPAFTSKSGPRDSQLALTRRHHLQHRVTGEFTLL